jgi:hypothetical protein
VGAVAGAFVAFGQLMWSIRMLKLRVRSLEGALRKKGIPLEMPKQNGDEKS